MLWLTRDIIYSSVSSYTSSQLCAFSLQTRLTMWPQPISYFLFLLLFIVLYSLSYKSFCLRLHFAVLWKNCLLPEMFNKVWLYHLNSFLYLFFFFFNNWLQAGCYMSWVFFIQPIILSPSHFQGSFLGLKAVNKQYEVIVLFDLALNFEVYNTRINKLKYFRWL